MVIAIELISMATPDGCHLFPPECTQCCSGKDSDHQYGPTLIEVVVTPRSNCTRVLQVLGFSRQIKWWLPGAALKSGLCAAVAKSTINMEKERKGKENENK